MEQKPRKRIELLNPETVSGGNSGNTEVRGLASAVYEALKKHNLARSYGRSIVQKLGIPNEEALKELATVLLEQAEAPSVDDQPVWSAQKDAEVRKNFEDFIYKWDLNDEYRQAFSGSGSRLFVEVDPPIQPKPHTKQEKSPEAKFFLLTNTASQQINPVTPSCSIPVKKIVLGFAVMSVAAVIALVVVDAVKNDFEMTKKILGIDSNYTGTVVIAGVLFAAALFAFCIKCNKRPEEKPIAKQVLEGGFTITNPLLDSR